MADALHFRKYVIKEPIANGAGAASKAVSGGGTHFELGRSDLHCRAARMESL